MFEGIEKSGISRRFVKKIISPCSWNSQLENDYQSLLKSIDLLSKYLWYDQLDKFFKYAASGNFHILPFKK